MSDKEPYGVEDLCWFLICALAFIVTCNILVHLPPGSYA